MKLTIKLFGGLKDHFDSSIDIELGSDATGNDLIAELIKQKPLAQDLLNISQIAVNEAFFVKDQLLGSISEVVVLPPFSGG